VRLLIWNAGRMFLVKKEGCKMIRIHPGPCCNPLYGLA
jgi:hypothetical protein